MKAVVLVRSGGPREAFELQELPERPLEPSEVRVDLVAAALNRREWWQRTGEFTGPAVLGSDGAGIVSAVGEAVTHVREGEEVVVNPSLDWGDAEAASGPDFRILGGHDPGTYAEQIVLPAYQVRPRPQNLTWEESAALPLAGLTAWRAAVTHAEARPGRTVLVTGAGGGVSTFAVQIAAALGARVLVTSSTPEKIRRAVDLGAAGGARYDDPEWPQQLGPVDAAIDSFGGPAWDGIFDCLAPGGRLVSFGRTGDDDGRVDIDRLFFGYWTIQGTTMGSPREFDALLAHVAKASWRPVLDSVFPLDDIASAHERLESPERFGKVVLAIRG